LPVAIYCTTIGEASPVQIALAEKSLKLRFHNTAVILLIVVGFIIVDLFPFSIWYLLINAMTS
jgi:hypothetical protein